MVGALLLQALPARSVPIQGDCDGIVETTEPCDAAIALERPGLAATLGSSLDEAPNFIDLSDLGFKYATEADLLSLYAFADNSVATGTSPLKNPSVEFLVPLFGCAFLCDTGQPEAEGFVDVADATPNPIASLLQSDDANVVEEEPRRGLWAFVSRNLGTVLIAGLITIMLLYSFRGAATSSGSAAKRRST